MGKAPPFPPTGWREVGVNFYPVNGGVKEVDSLRCHIWQSLFEMKAVSPFMVGVGMRAVSPSMVGAQGKP